MNIMNRLTVRCLKLNRRRTLVTMIGIIISAAMISGVATFAQSFLDWMIRSEIDASGNWHVRYSGVSSQNADAILHDGDTASCSMLKSIGYAELNGSQNEAKPYVYLSAWSQDGFENMPLHLTEGRLPQNSHEILISQHIIDNGGVSLSVGQTLSLQIGQRQAKETGQDGTLQTTTLNQNNPFGSFSRERLTCERTETYTIVGIIARPNSEPYTAPGYSIFTLLDNEELASAESLTLYTAVRNIDFSLYKHADSLAEQIGTAERPVTVKFNSYLLQFYRLTSHQSINRTLDMIVLFIILVIMIGSVSLIYNSFSISLSERSRYLGMLSSVGATRRQKRNSVFFEGALLGLISIPIGLLCGIAGIGITLKAISPLIETVRDTAVPLRLAVSPLSILTAAFFAALTIFVSSLVPSVRASRITPIDAIRQVREVRLTPKAVKTSPLTRKIFGFEGTLALKNLKRNKGRYRSTILSLTVSMTLFLTISFFGEQFRSIDRVVNDTADFDVQVTTYLAGKEEIALLRQASSLESAEKTTFFQTAFGSMTIDPSRINSKLQKGLDDFCTFNDDGTVTFSVPVIALEDDSFQRYLKDAKIDPGLMEGASLPAVIVNQTQKFIDEKYIQTSFFKDVPIGENIPLQVSKNRDITVTTAAITDKLPEGLFLSTGTTCFFVVSESRFEAVFSDSDASTSATLLAYTRQDERFTKEVQHLFLKASNNDYSIYNRAGNLRTSRNSNLIVCIFVYGFIILITLICIANIFNTVTTGMALRRREFAMLKSVGMGPRSLNKMLRYESFFYGFKVLLYGLPASFLLMLILSRMILQSFVYSFEIPWKAVLGAIAGVFLLIFLILLHSASAMTKESIVDGLKQENL